MDASSGTDARSNSDDATGNSAGAGAGELVGTSNTASTSGPGPFAVGVTGDKDEITHVAVPVEHLTLWQKCLDALKRGEQLAEHELAAFADGVERALGMSKQPATSDTASSVGTQTTGDAHGA